MLMVTVLELRRRVSAGSHDEVLRESDNLIPELPNSAYSCSRHSPGTAWFCSAQPGNFIPVLKTSTFLGVGVHRLSQ